MENVTIFSSLVFTPYTQSYYLLRLCKMRVLLLVSALVAMSSAASISLEDLEFHAWKLKFGKNLY